MKVLKILENKKEVIDEIKNELIKGKVLVLPTDTVYGLVCDSRNEQAVKRIFEIKKRSLNKPVGIFVKNIEMAKKIAQINEEQEKLLKEKWPGKFTFILRKKAVENGSRGILLPDLIGARKTIGIRIPDYELISDLFEKIDFALAQTSANISNEPATTKIQGVIKSFEKQKIQPDLIIDAGDLPGSRPSTVIDLTKKEPKILRKNA